MHNIVHQSMMLLWLLINLFL